MKQVLDNPQLGAFVVSFMVVAAFIGVLVYVMIHGANDNQTLQLLIGALIGAFGTVISYWIGSSSSSKNKDAVIAQQAQTAAAATITNGVKDEAPVSRTALHS